MFAKIFGQIFDSTIAEDYGVRHVFMDLLVLCDRDGVVDMTVPAISRRTNVPQKLIHKAIEKLCTPDEKSRSHLEDGRRLIQLDSHRDWGWQIVNYEHYRDLIDEESRRAYFRDKQREFRARSKPVKAVKDSKAPSKKITQVEASEALDVILSLTPEQLIGRIREIGPWRNADAIAAEQELVEQLAKGADAGELFKALCPIYLRTEGGKYGPQPALVIRRWKEPQQLWERKEKK